MKTFIVTDYGVVKDSAVLQTQGFQRVLDMCKDDGGKVVVPKGKYYISSVMMWSNTTLYLEAGAEIYGSSECDDYAVFDIPKGMEMRSDMELITQYYGKPWATYRRAMISCYGQKNVSIIGEVNSVLDGQNCYDGDGEEGYRGPHIVFFSCCENVLFQGYTARHSGNFLHEANNCKNLTMKGVTCLGGSDGIHLHYTQNAIVEDCLFKTGDDCVAGINVQNLTVRRCVFNTSCNLFRLGGVGILIENCYSYAPGYYPHRISVVKGKNEELSREYGRHNTVCMLDYFASSNYPFEPSKIVVKDSVFDGLKCVLYYMADQNHLQRGSYLSELVLENLRFTDLREGSLPKAPISVPLKITLKNSSFDFSKTCAVDRPFIIEDGANVTVIEE